MKLAGGLLLANLHTYTQKLLSYLFLDSLVVIRIHFSPLQARKCVYWFSLIAFCYCSRKLLLCCLQNFQNFWIVLLQHYTTCTCQKKKSDIIKKTPWNYYSIWVLNFVCFSSQNFCFEVFIFLFLVFPLGWTDGY